MDYPTSPYFPRGVNTFIATTDGLAENYRMPQPTSEKITQSFFLSQFTQLTSQHLHSQVDNWFFTLRKLKRNIKKSNWNMSHRKTYEFITS